MRIQIILDPARLWSWQKILLHHLKNKTSHAVSIQWNTRTEKYSHVLDRLLKLDQKLHSTQLFNALRLMPSSFGEYDTLNNTINHKNISHFDLIVNLSGSPFESSGNIRVLTPVYNGNEDDQMIIFSLLHEASPLITIQENRSLTYLSPAKAEVRACVSITDALEKKFALVIELILKAIRTVSEQKRLPLQQITWPIFPVSAQRTDMLKNMRYFSKRLQSKLASYMSGMYGAKVNGVKPSIILSNQFVGLQGNQPDRQGRLLSSDRYDIYQPAIVAYGGEKFIFYTCFDHDTFKSVLACIKLNEKNFYGQLTIDTPVIILERPYNISHPFIFEYQGEMWLIPSSPSNHTVELYRAVSFPDKWIFETMLFEDINLHGVTLFSHPSNPATWWMFAASLEWNSSGHDMLNIYSSSDPTGNWMPHQRNPVNMQAEWAEPGGNLFLADEKIVYPVKSTQKNSAAILFYEIISLNEKQFVHTPFQSGSQALKNWSQLRQSLPNTGKINWIPTLFTCDRYDK